MLEFRAIDFDESPGTSKQNFGRGFNNSGFAGTRWAQEQQVTDRTPGHVHTSQVNLVHVHDSANCAILSDDLTQKPPLKVQYFRAAHFWIEEHFFRNERFDHRFIPLAGLSQLSQDSR
jgi:hypothetical protein